jgi:hypothetical protein
VKARQSLDIEKLSELIKQEAPKDISPFEIKKLLHDMGRNELHTHISESVEFSLKWFKISRLILNYTKRRNYMTLLNKRKLASVKKKEMIFELDLCYEAFKVKDLWRHRMNLLISIAQAQWPQQNYYKLYCKPTTKF